MLRTLRVATQQLAGALPRSMQNVFLTGISQIARHSNSSIGHHLYAFACGVKWKTHDLPAVKVRVGASTYLDLIPHPGEIDFAASFLRQLDYELEVFGLIESIFSDFDLIIEIGANVGIFTCFLNKLKSQQGTATPTIISIEPSHEAYVRLCKNIQSNDIKACTINAAVGISSLVLDFFEPEGHLTNGSLLPGFAGIFSPNVAKSQVLSLGPEVFEKLFQDYPRVLIKMDVEGYEPQILNAWRSLIEKFRPSLIIEVLQQTEREINEFARSIGYRSQLILKDGLVEHARIFSDENSRDWFLAPNSTEAAPHGNA